MLLMATVHCHGLVHLQRQMTSRHVWSKNAAEVVGGKRPEHGMLAASRQVENHQCTSGAEIARTLQKFVTQQSALVHCL